MMKAAATLGICVLVTVLAVGCATAAKGPTDEQQVMSVLTQWSELLPAGEIDKLMALHSENFKSRNGDKAKLAGFLNAHKSDVKGATVDLATTKIVVTEGKATAMPVGLTGAGFSMDLLLEFAKENGQWMIVGMGEA